MSKIYLMLEFEDQFPSASLDEIHEMLELFANCLKGEPLYNIMLEKEDDA